MTRETARLLTVIATLLFAAASVAAASVGLVAAAWCLAAVMALLFLLEGALR